VGEAVIVLLLACVPILSLWLFTRYLEGQEREYDQLQRRLNPGKAKAEQIKARVVEIKTAKLLQQERKGKDTDA
jgi:hypothetical protein